jgi:hypothetical protein
MRANATPATGRLCGDQDDRERRQAQPATDERGGHQQQVRET